MKTLHIINRYIEEGFFTEEETDHLLSVYTPIPSNKTFYRTGRINPKQALISVSDNPYSSLSAAISFRFDSDLPIKSLTVLKITQSNIVVSHEELIKACTPEHTHSKKSYQLTRTKKEKELLLETNSLIYEAVLTFDYELVTEGKSKEEIADTIKHLAKVVSCYPG
jgi:hypothetical protein